MDDKIKNKILDYAKKCDERIDGYSKKYNVYMGKDNILKHISNLLESKSIEVGYRSSCGKSRNDTIIIHSEFQKALKFVKKQGLDIKVKSVEHGNAWATKAGGFWDSSIYSIEKNY